ncbi:Metallo-dependent hydrolase [Cantharellus anzutake]|uniref:Metallo-dependent hydrolase n=1 Tax=Cantharellus anzutake TaxID=1750568 RepID=UPI0019040502|nr:Metallo-dependent hydrolase [Cantharellus anzutake]KAF8335861.1 Metallo-dependent hydrolase [Cantharellus anzutake]
MAGLATQAFDSLPPHQKSFLRSLPKAELHAHLNGCIPLDCLIKLALDASKSDGPQPPLVREALQILKAGLNLNRIEDGFKLFPAIYHITSTPKAIALATSAVLDFFLEPTSPGVPPQCVYMELRTTPRSTPHMSRKEYLSVVLGEVVKRGGKASLIVSIDRRMSPQDVAECISLAIHFRNSGQPIVGIDLCGNPLSGNMKAFHTLMDAARDAQLPLTAHIAESERNTAQDTAEILSWSPRRLGHATFLDADAVLKVSREKIPIEICLSSNLVSKTVESLSAHHLRSWLELGHPVIICTDDTLLFKTNLVAEYALLLARPPLGLGFEEEEIRRIAQMGFRYRFHESRKTWNAVQKIARFKN